MKIDLSKATVRYLVENLIEEVVAGDDIIAFHQKVVQEKAKAETAARVEVSVLQAKLIEAESELTELRMRVAELDRNADLDRDAYEKLLSDYEGLTTSYNLIGEYDD